MVGDLVAEGAEGAGGRPLQLRSRFPLPIALFCFNRSIGVI
jgi:hypothetical protein